MLVSSLAGRALAGLPPFRGKGRLANQAGRWVSRLTRHTVACPGFSARLAVDLDDRIQRYMWAGCYEVEIVQTLPKLLGSGSVFVDIGAHIGFFTVLAAQLVGPTGRVLAFEPDPTLFARLTENTSTLPQVTPLNMAVSDRTEPVAFYRALPNESGWGSLIDIPGREVREVQCTTLDDWQSRTPDVRRIDLIKLDAEGCEMGILRHGVRMLESFRPALVLEVNEPLLERTGTSGSEVMHWLQDKGYECESLKPIAGSCGTETLLCRTRA